MNTTLRRLATGGLVALTLAGTVVIPTAPAFGPVLWVSLRLVRPPPRPGWGYRSPQASSAASPSEPSRRARQLLLPRRPCMAPVVPIMVLRVNAIMPPARSMTNGETTPERGPRKFANNTGNAGASFSRLRDKDARSPRSFLRSAQIDVFDRQGADAFAGRRVNGVGDGRCRGRRTRFADAAPFRSADKAKCVSIFGASAMRIIG